MVRADREAELLFRGKAYRRAIESFYLSNGTYPRELEDLLKDPRAPGRRHLRVLYPDPLMKGEQRTWAVVRGVDGGIAGVMSNSTEQPLKKANFPKEFEKFAEATSYAEWIFEYIPPNRPHVPGTPSPTPLHPPVVKTH
jgi:hypothetical protein